VIIQLDPKLYPVALLAYVRDNHEPAAWARRGEKGVRTEWQGLKP